MKESMVPYWLAFLLAVGLAYGGWRMWSIPDHGSMTEHDPSATDTRHGKQELTGPPLTSFELTDQDGQTFKSSSMAGEVWVVSFFYTSCPNTCVRLNQALAALQAEPQFDGARFLSISCDPDTDTPAVLKQYAERFHANFNRWTFCTGPLDYVQRLGQGTFQLTVQRQTHSDRAVIVDRAGEVRGRFIVTDETQLAMLRTVLLQCLREPKPEPKAEPAKTEPSNQEPASTDDKAPELDAESERPASESAEAKESEKVDSQSSEPAEAPAAVEATTP